MTEIIPAIMPKSFEDIETSSSKIKGLVNTAQIDIMDGIFVENKSWPYTEVEKAKLENGAEIKNILEGVNLPFETSLSYELDLMIQNPEDTLKSWLYLKPKRIIFHIESSEKIESIIKEIRGEEKNVEIGLALNIETPNEELDKYINELDFVQFMGIKTIGLQGEPFDERVLEKIKSFKNKNPSTSVSVDGGINEKSAQLCIDAGANRLASGSYILNSENPEGAVKNLQKVSGSDPDILA